MPRALFARRVPHHLRPVALLPPPRRRPARQLRRLECRQGAALGAAAALLGRGRGLLGEGRGQSQQPGRLLARFAPGRSRLLARLLAANGRLCHHQGPRLLGHECGAVGANLSAYLAHGEARPQVGLCRGLINAGTLQHLNARLVLEVDCKSHRHHPLLRVHVVSRAFDQRLGDGDVAGRARIAERRVLGLLLNACIRVPFCQERRHDHRVAIVRRQHQRRPARIVREVHLHCCQIP
mmetsp:Transcript_23452/g.53341  ORF Transcript_23452/g.53341 Transcript_23452/m.53341 type:complete len:237 (+) Transcript_23452:703-1413(+)